MLKPIPPASLNIVSLDEAPSNKHPSIARKSRMPHAPNAGQKLKRILIIKIGNASPLLLHLPLKQRIQFCIEMVPTRPENWS